MLKELATDELRCTTVRKETRFGDCETGICEITYELIRIDKGCGVYVLWISVGDECAAECVSSDEGEALRVFDLVKDSFTTPCGLYDALHNLKNSI